jgi:hypothetical protein
MPLCRILTSANVPEKARTTFLTELSRFVAGALRKPESYVMTSFTHVSAMTFAGTTEPACYVELKNIGTFTPEQTASLSADLCARIEKALGVPPSRTYIEFSNAAGHLWGHDGETFG